MLLIFAVSGMLMGQAAGAAQERTAVITPGVGISPVRLGMTFAQTRALLGRHPILSQSKRIGFGKRYVEYQWRDGAFVVGLVGRPGRERVARVGTTLRGERTREGVGPGSTMTEVRSRLAARGVRCESLQLGYSYELLPAMLARCTLRSPRVSTVFDGTPTCLVPSNRYQGCPEGKLRVVVLDVVVQNRSLAQYDV